MFSVKHLVAAITLGTAMLVGPSAISAMPVRHSSATSTHLIKHSTKKKHKRAHSKHTKKTSAKHVKSKHLASHSKSKHLTAASTSKHKSKTGSRHHPNL